MAYKRIMLILFTAMLLLTNCEIEEENQPPEVTILSPASGVYDIGQELRFSCVVKDPDGYKISNEFITWISSQDGYFGEGRSLLYSKLSVNEHDIVVTATDREGAASTDSVTIIISAFAASVTTSPVIDITMNSATGGGVVTSDGGAYVTARGVCWSTSPEPVISDNHTVDGNGTGSFSSIISGLSPNITYHVRAYATNLVGTAYGENVSFTSERFETGKVTDINGNRYKTVKIGDQWWMAENLNVTHYCNGDSIPHVIISNEWKNLSNGAYRYYYDTFPYYTGDKESFAATYGALYNWYAVNDARGLAPEGWHIPTDEEWKMLEVYLGMSKSIADRVGYRGIDEGKKLKSTSGWDNNGNGTDEVGFTALPGGCYNMDTGYYFAGGKYAAFWTASEYSSTVAWSRYLTYHSDDIYRYYYEKRDGLSVRCVRN